MPELLGNINLSGQKDLIINGYASHHLSIMMKPLIISIVFVLAFQGNVAAQWSTPDEAVEAWYQIHSFTDNEHPKPADYLSLFTPNAVLVAVQNDSLVTSTAEEYVELVVAYFDQFERNVSRELSRHTEHFGNMAQIRSAYVAESDGVEMGHGVFFFRLVRVQETWRINSMGGQLASDENPLPPQFLGN